MCKLFVLSPASVDGPRARSLSARGAGFPAAAKLREGRLELGEAFSYISSLYFRAKLLYAQRFAAADPACPDLPAISIIATGFGLVPPEWELDRRRLARLRRVPVDPARPSFCKPIEAHGQRMRELLPSSGRVVFLGSLARRKYLDVLVPLFGDRLLVPGAFVGRGQMQRGSLLLGTLEQETELDYVPAGAMLADRAR